jgi:CubicO group peptidase (beta-lactamase class C family)
MHIRSLVPLALLLTGCGGPSADVQSPPPPAPSAGAAPSLSAAPSAGTPPTPVPTQLAADTQTTTPAGATFMAPKGWWLTRGADSILLEDAEHDLTITFFETKAPSTEAALAAAWAAKKSAPPKTADTTKPPPTEGWDEVVEVDYELPSGQARAATATVRRKGDVTYVTLVEGATNALDRRASELVTATGSFRAKGVAEESFAGRKANPWDGQRLAAFSAFVEEARATSKVPGVAFAIVQGGNTVVARGFGVRALGEKGTPGPKTLFLIGSITKSLTTLMMARLVDEGRFQWDTPVTQVWPTFALADAEATKKLTMRHTVCACTGLPRQDFILYFGRDDATAGGSVALMKDLRPTTAFGETFQYSNIMVSTGGYLAAHTVDPKAELGAAYDATLRSRVLQPLGMTTSTFDTAAAMKLDHAKPHGLGYDGYVAFREQDERWLLPARPSGALWSSVSELARWVSLELARGKGPDGKQLVSEASFRARYTPMVKASASMSYGLGLMVEKYGGVDVAWHNGGTLGMSALALWLPAHDTGFVLLTNGAAGSLVADAVRRRFFELLFDGKERAKEELAFKLKGREKAVTQAAATIERAPGEAWAKTLAGTWTNGTLGKATVRWEKGRAVLDLGTWTLGIGRAKRDDGSELVVLLDPAFNGFSLVHRGNELVLGAAQDKYVFTRVP